MTLTNQKWHFGMMFVCHFGLKYGKCLVEIFLHPPTPASGSPMALSWFLWVILAGLAATIASICEFHLLVFTVTDMCLFYLPSGMDVLTVLLISYVFLLAAFLVWPTLGLFGLHLLIQMHLHRLIGVH